MQLLATIALGLAYVSLPFKAAEPPDNATGRDTRAKIAFIASPLDWGSKDVRIETIGGETRVIVRRQTFKGIRQVNVNYELDDTNSLVTLTYWVSTFVGPVTIRGTDYERSDLDVVWIFDTKEFKKMKAERKFLILCKGDILTDG